MVQWCSCFGAGYHAENPFSQRTDLGPSLPICFPTATAQVRGFRGVCIFFFLLLLFFFKFSSSRLRLIPTSYPEVKNFISHYLTAQPVTPSNLNHGHFSAQKYKSLHVCKNNRSNSSA